MQGFSSHDDL